MLCVTDGIDGYLARRQGTTRSGAFLDPLADKVLVLGAMFALVVAERFWWLPVVAHHRARARHHGLPRRTGAAGAWPSRRPLAKVKTVVQEVAVGFALLPLTADDHRWVADAVALGSPWSSPVVTGVQYVLAGSRAPRRQGSVASARPARDRATGRAL